VEATWLVPLVLSVSLFLGLFLMQLFDFTLMAHRMLSSVRAETFDWIQPEDGLYWDAISGFYKGGEYDASMGDVRLSREKWNDFGWAFGVKAQVKRSWQVGEDTWSLIYRIKNASVLPAYALRQAKLMEDEILPLLEDLLPSQNSDLFPQEVYIVDDSDKEHDYLKVYHLSKDCQYVRNKSYETTSRAIATAKGYRPCMICTKKEIAQKQESLLSYE